jgi:hypothetical protein
MVTISAGFSMSLDGFIAGPNDDVQRLFAWMYQGNTDLDLSSGDTDFDLNGYDSWFRVFQPDVDQIFDLD